MSDKSITDNHDAREKLQKLANDIDIALLTTIDDDGTMHSRPMATNGEVELDGDLWLFTSASSHKVDEVQQRPQVNVSFSDNRSHTYISISGTAESVEDRAKIKELWRPALKAWFPKGAEDPDIALLKVTATKAEYWDAPSGIAATLAMAKAIATGERPNNLGDHQKVALS